MYLVKNSNRDGVSVWTEESTGQKAWLCSQDDKRCIYTIIDDTTDEGREAIKRHREYIDSKQKQGGEKR